MKGFPLWRRDAFEGCDPAIKAIQDHDRDIVMLKSTLLVTILLFLIVAPEPDAKDIADITAKLIVSETPAVLMASDKEKSRVKRTRETSVVQ